MDFRKAFFPTKEELTSAEQILNEIMNEQKQFWLQRGLTEDEYEKLTILELNETYNLHVYQHYSSRKSLLEMGIITIDKVKKDINNIQCNENYLLK